MRDKKLKKVFFYKFVTWDVNDPIRNLTMADYKSWSTGSNYYPHSGAAKLLGYIYVFRDYLKKYWYQNGGTIHTAYALSPTDLKRVLRAQYETIFSDFKAVEVK